MPSLNWGLVSDGAIFESLVHSLLFADDHTTILFGRPGKDSGQDARSADGHTVFQAKYRQNLDMDCAINIARDELTKIKNYRSSSHPNFRHWEYARRWVLVANFSVNPNDDAKWRSRVVPDYQKTGLVAEYWSLERLERELEQHPEVRDVFFGGENRVLVGLKEAHNLLQGEVVGSPALDIGLIGRGAELTEIRDFVSAGDSQVLPIVGPPGIGKSRLIFEALVLLAEDGWRVLWGLPGSMSRSSRWFHLLNGPEKTCVALDAPDDPMLIQTVVEQLAAAEKSGWRVIVASSSAGTGGLNRLRTNKKVHEPLELSPLQEEDSKKLVNTYLNTDADPAWLHGVHEFTQGIPGWLCLVAALAKNNALENLPHSTDEIASIYVDRCLAALPTGYTSDALKLLRWLSLWGRLNVQVEEEPHPELLFLESTGLKAERVREILRQLAANRIVRNWGIQGRLFQVEPLILRHHILSNWMYCSEGARYEVSDEGRELVRCILSGEVPAADAALKSLAQLAYSRMDTPDAQTFLRPVFDVIKESIASGTLQDQYVAANLLPGIASSDPESVLDAITAIRKHEKKDLAQDDGVWGRQILTHNQLLSRLPWVLYQAAGYVTEPVVVRRFLTEFKALVEIEQAGGIKARQGYEVHALVKRLLNRPYEGSIFVQFGYKFATEELRVANDSRFLFILLESLMNPERESTDWTAKWTLTITWTPLSPGTDLWECVKDLRAATLAQLGSVTTGQCQANLWTVIAHTHHEFHRLLLHKKVQGPIAAGYKELIVSDLQHCIDKLQSVLVPSERLSEATYAREVWAWYLKYGKEDDPIELAEECERLYKELTGWDFPAFFQFRHGGEEAPERNRIADHIRNAATPDVIADFFTQVQQYVDASRRGRDDIDNVSLWSLADHCEESFSLTAQPPSALSEFIKIVLNETHEGSSSKWSFAVRVCQRHILRTKTPAEANTKEVLSSLLGISKEVPALLWEMYCSAHSHSVGELTHDELEILNSHKASFPVWQWFSLMGTFYGVDPSQVSSSIEEELVKLSNDQVDASNFLWRFVNALHISELRYDLAVGKSPVKRVVDWIARFQLDGEILDPHKLIHQTSEGDSPLSTVEFVQFIESRINMESSRSSGSDLTLLPHDFDVSVWVKPDLSRNEEFDAFKRLCFLSQKRTFVAIYWIPRFLPHMDPDARVLFEFVKEQTQGDKGAESDTLVWLAKLISFYDDESPYWHSMAEEICGHAGVLPREKRYRVYSSLVKNEIVTSWVVPGEVSPHALAQREKALRQFENEPDDSPLRDFRQWALERSRAWLRQEQAWLEEDDDA